MTMGKKRSKYIVAKAEVLALDGSLIAHAKGKLLYNELAHLFELAISRDTPREVETIHEVIVKFHPTASSILDLGCGIGRHSTVLNEQYGYHVTGVDQSEHMLKIAKQRCPSCTFVQGDLRSIDLTQTFDVAIIMWTTFNYLSSPSEAHLFFENVHKHLNSNGLLIINVKNYFDVNEREYTREVEDENYKLKVTIRKSIDEGHNEGIYDYEVTNLKTGVVERFTDQEIAKVYSAQQIEEAAVYFFAPELVLGDYDITTQHTPDTSERIIVALKRKDL